MTEFVKFPKIPRYVNERVTITEKIDGTNAAVAFDGDAITCQSRSRIITPDDDNYGFARWAYDNADELHAILGDGLHFGEWWGKGVQRNYGMPTKAFSLFNTHRWADLDATVGGLPVRSVPVLFRDAAMAELDWAVGGTSYRLLREGSKASRGFMNPEGLMLYLHESGKYLKVPFDAAPKGSAA